MATYMITPETESIELSETTGKPDSANVAEDDVRCRCQKHSRTYWFSCASCVVIDLYFVVVLAVLAVTRPRDVLSLVDCNNCCGCIFAAVGYRTFLIARAVWTT